MNFTRPSLKEKKTKAVFLHLKNVDAHVVRSQAWRGKMASTVASPVPLLIADRKFVVRWAGKWRECMKNKPNFRASELEILSLHS